MGWSIGWDGNWRRDVGYAVPAVCDQPGCNTQIHRGLSYVCGGDAYGGEQGCGLFFCDEHLCYDINPLVEGVEVSCQMCDRCADGKEPYEPKKDVKRWTRWKMTHPSWAQWRRENGFPEPTPVTDGTIR